MKDIRATGEASSPQKRKFIASKQYISSLFFFVVQFRPPVSEFGSALPTDPDPADQNHSRSGSATLKKKLEKSDFSIIASLAFLKPVRWKSPEVCVANFNLLCLLILIPGSKFSRWMTRLVLLSAFNTFGKPHVELVPVK
jgi:hypothetical protein